MPAVYVELLAFFIYTNPPQLRFTSSAYPYFLPPFLSPLIIPVTYAEY